MKQTLTVDLEAYVAALIGGAREFAVVDETTAQSIRSQCPLHESVCKIERDSWTVSYSGRPLAELGPNLWRIWYKKDYDNCYNRELTLRNTIEQRAAERTQRKATMLEAVRNNFLAQGLLPQVVDMVVNGMEESTLEATYNSIKSQ